MSFPGRGTASQSVRAALRYSPRGDSLPGNSLIEPTKCFTWPRNRGVTECAADFAVRIRIVNTGNSSDKSSLSFIRHELKTPINAIIGYSEMLLEDLTQSDDPGGSLYAGIEHICSAGHEMLALVNNLKLESDLDDRGSDLKPAIHAITATTIEIAGRLLKEVGKIGDIALTDDVKKIQAAGKLLLSMIESFFGTETHADSKNKLDCAGGSLSPSVDNAVPLSASSQAEQAGHGNAGQTILVVDDYEMNRDLLSRQLQKQGYSYETACNGREAMEIMRLRRFDLVLMDVIMPGMDGIQALKELKRDPQMRHIPVIMVSTLDDMEKIVQCIEIGAEDYLPKPPDPVLLQARLAACLEKKRLIDQEIESQKRLKKLNEALDARNRFIRKTFGRYLSDEIVENILETPEGLKLGGEKRRVTVMMSDLRGFTSIAERISPEDVVAMLNIHLEVMTGIIMKYNGTIGDFIGDSILAMFGAPVQRDDDAVRAVACAVEMQLAMEEVNRRNREASYPEVAMGIGINTGNVVVGNIGCSERVKYSVMGRNVNLSSRIESYTVGGQILLSLSTLEACHEELDIGRQMEVMLKGVRGPITIYEVEGVGGKFNVRLPQKKVRLASLKQPLPVRFAIIEGKHSGSRPYEGEILSLHRNGAEIRAGILPEVFTNLRICLHDNAGATSPEIFAKVTENVASEPPVFRVHYTYVSPDADSFLTGITAFKQVE